jgi:serine protease inhibitor
MSSYLKIACLIMVCVFLLSCGDTCVSPECDQPRMLTAAERRLVSSYNAFGLNIFRELVSNAPPDTNIFISPTSISMALGMTLNGAAGATEDAMKMTLDFGGMDIKQINECYRSVIDLLTGLDPDVTFEIANSIWHRPTLPVKAEFLDACRTYFDSEVRPLDFSRPDAPDTINAWVCEKTHEKIEEIINGPIHPLTMMFLINAIYFLGNWTYQFDPDLTQDDWFLPEDGIKTPCRMMLQPGDDELAEYSYLETDEFQAIDLPYGNGLFSMTILLPKPKVSLDRLIDGCDQATWDGWMTGFRPHEGRIQLPKFEIEYEDTLNKALIDLGMGVAFGNRADFSRISDDRDLYISSVRHKTYVRVDEVGTEAAAVTIVEMREVSLPDVFSMRVDRPFLFAIREHHSGTLLFIAKINDPGLLKD